MVISRSPLNQSVSVCFPSQDKTTWHRQLKGERIYFAHGFSSWLVDCKVEGHGKEKLPTSWWYKAQRPNRRAPQKGRDWWPWNVAIWTVHIELVLHRESKAPEMVHCTMLKFTSILPSGALPLLENKPHPLNRHMWPQVSFHIHLYMLAQVKALLFFSFCPESSWMVAWILWVALS